jgi:V/A-type H+-transporting ATPase subunit I
MLLFGAMFGDVGQGMILFIMGEVLNRRNHRPNLGGVVARLGMSSVIFGFLYGSLFGYEEILPAIVVKPMDKINLVLIAAVVFGAILLSISFVFNLISAYKSKDIENGIFSRNGLVGLCFYWLLLYVIIALVTGTKTFLPSGILTLTLVLFLGLMLFKEPISNLIKGVRPLYHESKSDYFIEGGFGVVETLLSMFSNTVSFIRVGAFAINHVGLFIAFDTLAKMMTNSVESAMMIILGNVIIIGLEGLIVFIQGLRLEYYELFSKYFSGVGYEYNPIVLRMYKSRLSRFKSKFSRKQNIPVNMN